MKPSSYVSFFSGFFLLLLLYSCAAFKPATPNIGDSEAKVIALLGNPTHRYQDGKHQLLEYAHGPWGQQTYMARFAPNGSLISYEQVLTSQKFASIQKDKDTKNEVLLTIGAPSETSYLSLSQLEVWSYPYKENGAWNSIMHVHFDKQGIVRKMLNSPDPRFDPDEQFPFGILRN